MSIAGYPVIGQVKTSAGVFPLVDIPMMSDEKLLRLIDENAVHNYIREHGYEPESTEAALKWQSSWLATMKREGGAGDGA